MPQPYSLHVRGDFTPAACIRCTRGNNLVDIADDIPGYGRPYFCMLCIGELADALGYVDPAVSAGRISAAEESGKLWRERYETLAAQSTGLPDRIKNATKELAHGITNLADDFARHIVSAAGGSPDLPIRDGLASAAPTAGGALLGHGEDTRDLTPPVGTIGDADSGRSAGGLADEPRVPQGNDGADLGRDGADATADAEVDGPELDASFGWIEQVAGADS